MVLILLWFSFISEKHYRMLPDKDMLLTDGNQYLSLIWKNKGQMKVDYILSPFTFIYSTRGSKSLFIIQNILQLVDQNLLFIPRAMSFQMINMFSLTEKRGEILVHQKLMQKTTGFSEVGFHTKYSCSSVLNYDQERCNSLTCHHWIASQCGKYISYILHSPGTKHLACNLWCIVHVSWKLL